MKSFARWIIRLLSVGVTGYGLFAYLPLEPGRTVHPDMKAAYTAHPGRILTHVVFSAVALLIGPFQFFPALHAARQRDFARHERWAIRSFALTFSAVTLRIYLGSFFALGLPFEDFHPVLAWLCWVPNLLLVGWGLLARPPATAPRRPVSDESDS